MRVVDLATYVPLVPSKKSIVSFTLEGGPALFRSGSFERPSVVVDVVT